MRRALELRLRYLRGVGPLVARQGEGPDGLARILDVLHRGSPWVSITCRASRGCRILGVHEDGRVDVHLLEGSA